MENKHPRLTKFLRKMNRGVALALALIIAMSAYIIIDGIRFNNELPEIEKMSQEYLKGLLSISENATDSITLEVGELERLREALGDITETYYTDSAAAQKMYERNTVSAVQLMTELDKWASGAFVPRLTSIDFPEDENKIPEDSWNGYYIFSADKMAGKYLEVYFSFVVDVEYLYSDAESFPFLLFDGKNGGGYYETYAGKSESDISLGYSNAVVLEVRSKAVISGTIYFVRESGKWKIACTKNFGYGIISSNAREVS